MVEGLSGLFSRDVKLDFYQVLGWGPWIFIRFSRLLPISEQAQRKEGGIGRWEEEDFFWDLRWMRLCYDREEPLI